MGMGSKIGREISRKIRARKLINHNFSIISNTCVGGVISNSLGEQFRSPTVNLVIHENEFITFVENLKEYSTCEIEKPNESEIEQYKNFKYPVGILRGKNNLPDIPLFFVHYGSFDDAVKKWHDRFNRINYDDLYILMDRGMDASDELLDKFNSLPFKNKVFFTHKQDSQRWKNNFTFSFYNKEKYKNGCLYSSFKRGLAEYRCLDEFDYTEWLNNGKIQKSNLKIKLK